MSMAVPSAISTAEAVRRRRFQMDLAMGLTGRGDVADAVFWIICMVSVPLLTDALGANEFYRDA
jgi:hypothetical protein